MKRLPPDAREWATRGVHWHAFARSRPREVPPPIRLRPTRLITAPDEVLSMPEEVATWIKNQTWKHVTRRSIHIPQHGVGHVGDANDREAEFTENYFTACRGDSIYVVVYAGPDEQYQWDLFVEAVTNEQCVFGCIDSFVPDPVPDPRLDTHDTDDPE